MQIKIISLIIFTLLALCFYTDVSGQRIITGKVLNLNSKQPVEGVSVTVFRGTDFTNTTEHGYFQLTLNDEDSLVFTHPNYKTGGLKLPEVNTFVIYMEQYDYYPEYVNGDLELYDYLMDNLKIPKKVRYRAVEGILLVELLIDASGSIVSCSALNELCTNCQDEIIEVFSNIPGEWSKSDAPFNKRLIFPIVIQIGPDGSDINVPQMKLPEGKLMRAVTLAATADGQIIH